MERSPEPAAPHTSAVCCGAGTPTLPRGIPLLVGRDGWMVPGARVMASPAVCIGDLEPTGFHPKTGGYRYGTRPGTAG